MARKTEITAANLVKLGAEKLARLVLEETERNAGLRRRVSAALAGQAGPLAVAKVVDRRLAGLERAKSFIEWEKARAFRDDLQSLIDVIEAELIEPAPALATDRLLRFVATHEAVFDRVDDSHGDVQDVYHQAIEMIGKAAAGLDTAELSLLPDKIMASLGETTHGYLTDIAENVAIHLPKTVLQDWDADLIARIETRTAEDGARGTERWYYSMTSQWRDVRQTLAEARGDLDLLIALETEKPARLREPIALAKTLLEAGRPEDALTWIRQDDNTAMRPMANPRQLVLEAEILRHLDRRSEATDLLWKGFTATLSAELLRAHLRGLPDFEDIEAEDCAMRIARNHSNRMAALMFFMEWPRLDQAAALVAAHEDRWDGSDWHVLPEMADTLRQDHPVAATILYRKLLDSILARARSKAYGHAARYLATLGAIASAAETDPDRPPALSSHATYLDGLKTQHARKSGFWARVAAI
ncbi:MAG: DUF6880 family protein [Pseudomonadota bacterium]